MAAPGDLAEAHRLLDAAVTGGNFEYATKVGSVLDTLQRLLDAGSRADLAPLARRTVDDIIAMLEQVDDASGVVADELDRGIELYARACAAHPPNPGELASWILAVEFDGLEIDLAEFAKALGEKGIQRIKSTVDEVLAKGEEDVRYRTASRLQEELAEISGDVDALVSAVVSATEGRALARASQAASFEPSGGGCPCPAEPLRNGTTARSPQPKAAPLNHSRSPSWRSSQAWKPAVWRAAAASILAASSPVARLNQRSSETPQLIGSKWVSITSSSIRTRARSAGEAGSRGGVG